MTYYRALLAAAEDIYGRPLRQDNLLPHLLCRPCERRLKNFIAFKTVISESQRSFETVKRCTEISPSVPRTLAKSSRESEGESRRGLNFFTVPSSPGKEVKKLCYIIFFPDLILVTSRQCQYIIDDKFLSECATFECLGHWAGR